MRNHDRTPVAPRRQRWRTAAMDLMFAAALLAFAPGLARAQDPVARTVEFDQAVQLAVSRNPNVAAAATAISRADAVVQQARAITHPGVNASLTNVTLDGSRGFEGTTTQPQNQSTFGVAASMPVFTPVGWAQVAQARDQVEIATISTAEARRQIAIATGGAYLSVITAKRQVDVNLRALESSRAHLDYAQKRLEGGAGSRLNQLRAAQVVASEEARLESTRLLLRRAQEALGVLIAEDGPVDAGADPMFDVPASINEAEWMAARPDLQLQAANIRATERTVNDVAKFWQPQAAVSFNPLVVTPGSLFSPSRTWSLAVNVSQRVFDPTIRAERALRTVALSQGRYTQTAAEIQARSEVRLAQAAIASFERALTSARLAATQASEVLQITTRAFEIGATTNLEVIDAQRTARDTDTGVTVAEDQVRRAKLDLLVALGRFPR